MSRSDVRSDNIYIFMSTYRYQPYGAEESPISNAATHASAAMSCAELASITSPVTSPKIGVLPVVVTKSRQKSKPIQRSKSKRDASPVEIDSDSDEPFPKAQKTVSGAARKISSKSKQSNTGTVPNFPVKAASNPELQLQSL
jgi:hypothetical protein